MSIDKTSIEHPMLLRLSSTSVTSTDVGRSIITSTSNTVLSYAPKVYKLAKVTIGSNSANFTATTSYMGILHYAIVKGDTPRGRISHS